MTFCGTFRKNLAGIECATHHERLHNACVWLKNIFQRISPKCQRFSWVISRSSRPDVFFKRGVLENFTKFTGNPLYWSLFLIKLQSSSPQLYLRRDSSTGVFLWILRYFKEYLRATAWIFTISRDVSHYAFLSVGIINKTLLMKIFEEIFAMPAAKEQEWK